MRRNSFVPAAAAIALVAGLVSVIGARTAEAVPAMHPQAINSTLPDVYPTPQSMHARGNAIPLGNRVGRATVISARLSNQAVSWGWDASPW